MSQNQAAFVARAAAGGAALLNLDGDGNLLVNTGGAPTAAATPVSNSSGNKTNANAVATLPAAAGKTTHISGFALTGAGATAAGSVLATVVGAAGGTLSFVVPVPEGADIGIAPLLVQFNPPLAASALNTAIVVTLPAAGTGNTQAAATAWGYQE
jgi:hypothetical protein